MPSNKFTNYFPSTCFCVIQILNSDPNNQRQMKLIKQCRVHKTIRDVFNTNRENQYNTGTIEEQIKKRSDNKKTTR